MGGEKREFRIQKTEDRIQNTEYRIQKTEDRMSNDEGRLPRRCAPRNDYRARRTVRGEKKSKVKVQKAKSQSKMQNVLDSCVRGNDKGRTQGEAG